MSKIKLKDIIYNVKREKELQDDINLELLADIFALRYDYQYYDSDLIRLKSYYFGSWYDSGGEYGYKVYFLDDVPVALSSQFYRKSEEKIEWISKELFIVTREYVKTLLEQVEYEGPICLSDLEQEINSTYRLNNNIELRNYHNDIALYEGKKVKIIEKNRKKNFKDDDPHYPELVKIELENKKRKWVNVRKLEFPYNLINSEYFIK